jgi:hypothetical protein
MSFLNRLGGRALAIGAALAFTACASTPPPAPAPVAPPPPEEAPEVFSNTLKWSTASEVDNFGFDVYRGDTEEGPFERLTESPIEGAGTTDLTTSYAYEDTTIDPNREYFYYVESISLQGIREQFTPIIRAKPKLPKEGEEGEEPEED